MSDGHHPMCSKLRALPYCGCWERAVQQFIGKPVVADGKPVGSIVEAHFQGSPPGRRQGRGVDDAPPSPPVSAQDGGEAPAPRSAPG